MKTKYLKHADSGLIYPYTEALAEHVKMIPYTGPEPFGKGRARVTPRPATGEVNPELAAQRAQAQMLATTKEKYTAEFGSPPHPNMKLETMQARLAEADMERIAKAEQVPFTPNPEREAEFSFGDSSGE